MGDFLGFPPHHTEMNYENLFKEEHVRTFFQFRKKFNRDLENIQKKNRTTAWIFKQGKT